MDITPQPRNIQTAKRVNRATNDPYTQPNKYKSYVKSQMKATTLNFTSENPFSIFLTEHDTQTTTTSEISTTRQEKKKFLQMSLHQKLASSVF
jgi:hypothetical protein